MLKTSNISVKTRTTYTRSRTWSAICRRTVVAPVCTGNVFTIPGLETIAAGLRAATGLQCARTAFRSGKPLPKISFGFGPTVHSHLAKNHCIPWLEKQQSQQGKQAVSINLELLNSSNSSVSNLGYLQTSLKDPLLSVSLFCHLASIILCALILSETLALYKSFTYLLTYLLITPLDLYVAVALEVAILVKRSAKIQKNTLEQSKIIVSIWH